MANLSPWFAHIESARRALDLADTWVASLQMEVVQRPLFDVMVEVSDQDLDQVKASQLTRDQLIIKFDEYRQRLEDPLQVGQALAHIFFKPERLVNIPADTNNPFLAQLRKKLFAGLPQKFDIVTIDPLSWNILGSFLAHRDSKSRHDPEQASPVQILTVSALFEPVVKYIERTKDSMRYLATWEVASADPGTKRIDGYLPLEAKQVAAKRYPLPNDHLAPPAAEMMLNDLRVFGPKNHWRPTQARWYIQIVLEHPVQSVKAFEVAKKMGMLFNFQTHLNDPGVIERFRRWACHCAILVRSNGIWLSTYSTFSKTLSVDTVDRLFTALFG
jgi:hypothetical protein